MQISFILIFSVLLFIFPNASAEQRVGINCISIETAGYIIDLPGNYCVTKNISTRLDFPDHRAEHAIVEVRSNDVTIDLLGHTLGRWTYPFEDRSKGFIISSITSSGNKYKNILIKNGKLKNFSVGIYFYSSKYGQDSRQQPIEETPNHGYIYRESNIEIQNIIFESCEKDLQFLDWK